MLLQPLETALAHHEFQARLELILPVSVLIEDAKHRFALVDQHLFGDELIQHLRFDRQRSQAGAYGYAEATLTLANHRAHSDIVDRQLHAILIGAAVEGELEFARQIPG